MAPSAAPMAMASTIRRDRHARIGGVEHRHDHAGEGEVGGDRQVDAPGQDHRRLAERQDDQDRGVVEDVARFAGRRRPEAQRDQARSARR